MERLTNREYFGMFPVAYSATLVEKEAVIDAAIEEARSQLPGGTVFEIRARMAPDTPEEDANWAVAWYHAPGVTLKEPLLRLPVDEPQHWEEAGLDFIARLAV